MNLAYVSHFGIVVNYQNSVELFLTQGRIFRTPFCIFNLL